MEVLPSAVRSNDRIPAGPVCQAFVRHPGVEIPTWHVFGDMPAPKSRQILTRDRVVCRIPNIEIEIMALQLCLEDLSNKGIAGIRIARR
jgi:hypothetical protein